MVRVSEIVTQQLQSLIDAQRTAVVSLWTPLRNVDGYGAIGDGTTDDLEALKTAASVSGVLVLAPGKTYLISAKWTPTVDNLIIWGYGATLKTTANITMLEILDRTNVWVYGLKFDAGGGNANFGIESLDSDRTVVKDCYFTGLGMDAVYIGGDSGFAYGTDIIIENNIAVSPGRNGVSNVGGDRVIIRGNIVTSPAYFGVDVEPYSGMMTRWNVIEGNVVDGAGQYHIAVAGGSAGGVDRLRGCVISGNTLRGGAAGAYSSIYATDLSGITIIGNNVDEVTNANRRGIWLRAVSNAVVNGNTLRVNSSRGITLEKTNHFTCNGNVVRGPGQGITLDGSKYGAVIGNEYNTPAATGSYGILAQTFDSEIVSHVTVNGNTVYATSNLTVGIDITTGCDRMILGNNVAIGGSTANIRVNGGATNITQDNNLTS